MSAENDNKKDEISEILANAEQKVQQLSERAQKEKALEKKMGQRFEKNIVALKKYLPDIAAQFRHYKPESMQFFCAPSGDANIVESTSGVPLYSDDPIEQCRDQVQRNIEQPKYTSIGFSSEEEQSNTFIHSRYMGAIYKEFLKEKETLEPLTSIPEHLGAMIMFGVGLGYHLPALFEQVTIDHMYICEPSNDLFYASLFTCDWEYVLKTIDEKDGVLHLRLGVDYQKFTDDFINELKDKGSFNASNAVLYQHYPSEQIQRIINEFSQQFHMVAIGWGFFDDGVISIAHDYANAQNKTPYLKKTAALPRHWKDVPAIIVANGPSIDATIEYVKAHQNDGIVFCCGTAINTLLKHGIVPDFHVELERTKLTYDLLVEFVDNEQMKQMNFLSVNVMHPRATELFKWSGLAFKPAEPSTIISSEFIDKDSTFTRLSYCNPLVANTALSYACYMGFKEIYLFGVDNGYVTKDHFHSKQSYYYTEDGEEKTEITKMMLTDQLEVEGNFGDTVFTTAFYDTGRHSLGHLLGRYPKVNCYNCSDGAKINHTFPVYPEDLLISPLNVDKNDIVEYIKSEFFAPQDHDPDAYQNWLAINKFDDIVDEMLAFTDKKFTSRGELATALKLQVRYLYSFSQTRFRHLYFMLDGSVIYAHTVFRMALYGFADEKEMLRVMHSLLDLYHEYLREAKKKFRRVLEEVDEQDFKVLEMFRKGHKKAADANAGNHE